VKKREALTRVIMAGAGAMFFLKTKYDYLANFNLKVKTICRSY